MPADWTCDFSNTATQSVQKWEWTNYNASDEDTTTTVSWSDGTYNEVAGATSTEPPWTPKFTPISYNWVSVVYLQPNVTIHAHKRLTYYLNYSTESGAEQWSGVDSEGHADVFERTRHWDSPHIVTHQETSYP